LKVMGKKLVRKSLEMLRKLADADQKKDDDDDNDADDDDDDDDADAPSKYEQFWSKFGKNIKLGVIEDASNRAKLAKLLRFRTSKSDGKLIGLQEYVDNMKEWQKNIYFIAGESIEQLLTSPFLERMQAKDIEVVLMADPLDEYCTQNLPEFDGKKLQSITKEGLKFGDESEDDAKREKLYKETFKPLTDWMGTVYGDNVEKVAVSNRVLASPSVLVTSQWGYSANMERIMKNQAFGDSGKQQYMISKKTMEINPRHPIIAELAKRVEADDSDDDAKDLAKLLFDTALLNSGFAMENPVEFAQRMYRLMKTGLSLDNLDLLPEIDIPEEEEEQQSADDAVEDLDADLDEKDEL